MQVIVFQLWVVILVDSVQTRLYIPTNIYPFLVFYVVPLWEPHVSHFSLEIPWELIVIGEWVWVNFYLF